MKDKIKLVWKYLFLFISGAITYMTMEFMWRHHTHWTMGIVGGVCFLEIGLINEIMPWDVQFPIQVGLGATIITANEFISGLIINIWLKMDIWDYSDLQFNIMGQICLLFCIVWIFVSAFAIVLDDYIRYIFFNEDRPRYKIGNKIYYPFKKKK